MSKSKGKGKVSAKATRPSRTRHRTSATEIAQGHQGTMRPWEVSTIRMTGFPYEVVDPAGWWNEVSGDKPESIQTIPKTGEIKAEGTWRDQHLVLASQVDRIEWALLPVFPRLTLGTFDEVVDSFQELLANWWPVCPRLQRIAFGADLVLPATDRDTAYHTVNDMMTVVKVDPQMRDFTYRVNRPRTVTFDQLDVEINRLASWAVIIVMIMRASRASPAFEPVPGTEQVACRLQLDINTAPELDLDVEPMRLPDLFRVLVAQGREIAERGDIK